MPAQRHFVCKEELAHIHKEGGASGGDRGGRFSPLRRSEASAAIM